MELTDTVHVGGEHFQSNGQVNGAFLQISKSFTVSQADDRIRSSQSV